MTTWRQPLARWAYSVLLRLLSPFYVLRMWRRGRAEPLYRHAIAERLGVYASTDAPSSGWVWVHAVSLGETRAAAALVDALRLLRPDMKLLLTHSTATGREAGRTLLRAGDRQAWLPYDASGVVKRFFKHFQPAVGVLMETEVWPNLMHAARAYGVPMVLANARLSAKSHAKSRRLDALMRPAARHLTRVLAQTEADAQRLRDAGALHVEVSGNVKYDVSPDLAQLARGAAWRQLLKRPVVLAAITREGEEGALLQAWVAQRAAAVLPSTLTSLTTTTSTTTTPTTTSTSPLLLIVPRHPQRFDEVAALVRDASLTLARRSSWGSGTPTPQDCAAQVWLGDSMHEMALYYATAQVALLGGSFAPLGGHNLIEAAACGCPLVMGPSTFNFTEAALLSQAAGASAQVDNNADGVALALDWLNHPEVLAARARNAVAFAAQHRGAAMRMAGRIVELLAED